MDPDSIEQLTLVDHIFALEHLMMEEVRIIIILSLQQLLLSRFVFEWT